MAVNRDRKTVELCARNLDLECYTLAEARDIIQELIECYGPDAKIDKFQEDYSDRDYLAVMIKRPETDEEMASRILKEEHYEAKVAERDLTEFQRLKKVFGQ